MPITNDRRPPGRPATRRRPPRGHATLGAISAERFEAVLAGTWTPPEPVRAVHGSQPDKVSTSVILSKDLFDRVDALAKDPETTARLGYSLRNARQVAIAALAEAYPMPAEEPAE